MANSTRSFLAAIRSALGGAWPDILKENGGGGIYSDIRALQRGLGAFTYPYAVYRVPAHRNNNEAEADDEDYPVTVDFYYIQASAQDEDNLADKQDAMIRWVRTHPLADGEWEIARDVQSDSTLDLNRIAREEKLQLLACRVSIACRIFIV